jgi:hypothetical protein
MTGFGAITRCIFPQNPLWMWLGRDIGTQCHVKTACKLCYSSVNIAGYPRRSEDLTACMNALDSTTRTMPFSSLMTLASFPQDPHRRPAREPVMATRLFTGHDGLSHVEQLEVKFSPLAALPQFELSEPIEAARSLVVRVPPGYFHDWHNADVRRYVIPVSGLAELEVSGGDKVPITSGRIYIVEDLTGKGHTFRVVGDQDWVGVFVDFAH